VRIGAVAAAPRYFSPSYQRFGAGFSHETAGAVPPVTFVVTSCTNIDAPFISP